MEIGWTESFVPRSQRDGLDATEIICDNDKEEVNIIGQIRAVILDGITYGGFNVIAYTGALQGNREIPVIVVMRAISRF